MTKREMLNLVSKITNPQGVVVLVTTDTEEPNGMTLADWLKQADAPKD